MLVSERADVARFTRCTGLTPVSVRRVAETNAFPSGIDAHGDAWRTFRDDDVVVLCAGPLGRVLAVRWFRRQPRVTYLELGSFFDPELQPDGKTLGARYYGTTQCGTHLNASQYKPRRVFRACNFKGDTGRTIDEQAVWQALSAGGFS